MSIPKTAKARTDAVLERDGHRCVIGGPECRVRATVADHRANRGNGGSKLLNDLACLIAACVICNGLKEDADGPYRARLVAHGIRVEKAATNAQTLERCRLRPVLYPDGWFRLVEGRREPVNAADAIEYMVLIGAIKAVS